MFAAARTEKEKNNGDLRLQAYGPFAAVKLDIIFADPVQTHKVVRSQQN